MTYREKLMSDHPEWDEGEMLSKVNSYCPCNYGYEDPANNCTDRGTCKECWDREIDKSACEPKHSHKTKVLCISGKAQHAKDTSASFLKEALEAKGKKVLIAHYGDLVKYVCKTFFDWNGEKDEAGRTLLQHLGTEIIRAKSPNYWVQFILSILEHFPNEWDYVLIPDCRFPNEIECVKNAGWDTLHVRVIRSGNGFVSPLTEEQQNHISETALDNVMPDFLILNYGTLEDLRDYVYELARYLEG